MSDITTSQDLAEHLARIARKIRDCLIVVLQSTNCESQASLHRQYHTFKNFLLPFLSENEFADLYAQTLAYGLFSAKLSTQRQDNFSRITAYHYLASNPFLRKLFLDVADELNGTVIEPLVDDLVAVLNSTDMSAILENFGKKTKASDTVIHFYETFLASYNPDQKAKRGVYYTPEPVVQFMVRSVDWLLQTRFNCSLGLADKDVNILDPATGTGTFLHAIVRSIHQTMSDHGQIGNWQDYVAEYLIPRIHGFELLMAPYVVAHLKMKLLLQELGYTFPKDKRQNIFLANALETPISLSEDAKNLGAYISDEAEQAHKVKEELGIMVVMGNPPYNVVSMNPSKNAEGKLNFIGELLQDYYYINNERIKERNPKSLQDDYVKFIRFAQWRIQKTGYGIVAFITNHGYLDNVTFGGMRQQLLAVFDEIFILNLHGNSRKKETALDGSTDENVFDIQQGVSIFLGIKLKKQESQQIAFPTEYDIPQKLGQIFYAEVWGTREKKYQWLTEFSAENISWQILQPTTPSFLFIPQDTSLRAEYELGWPVNKIFLVHTTGIKTHRDHLVIALDRVTLQQRIQTLLDKNISDDQIRIQFNLKDNRDWQLATAREQLREHFAYQKNHEANEWDKWIIPCLYRPFDIQWLFYSIALMDWPRYNVMQHLIGHANFALMFTRQVSNHGSYSHTGVSQILAEGGCFHNSTYIAPLYLYASQKKQEQSKLSDSPIQFDLHQADRCHNFSEQFISEFANLMQLQFIPDGQGNLRTTFGPEDIFYYMYAILYCPTYRSRYAEFLKLDFPHIPLTSDKKLFAKLVTHGHDLVELHLLRSPYLENCIATYPIPGNHYVERVQYAVGTEQTNGDAKTSGNADAVGTEQTNGDAKTSGNVVWINSTQYFGNIPQPVWEFQIGGRQVCNKWLSERKGRQLTLEEIQHYQKMITAITQTLTNMTALEKLIPKFPLA